MEEGRRPVVLWPVYFDATKSRSSRRRVPASLAVRGVTPEDLLKAAQAAGYRAELDASAKHPATWFESSGRVLVYTDERKSLVIRKVAEQLKKLKSERPEAARKR
ncbi:MAG: signal recognition particle subunit SRP19/SEC65 family protein [Thermofilaceae archaeon]